MAPAVVEFKLLGTSGCHLCDLAEDLLAGLLAEGQPWQIELIDIADDESLLARYATSIPVLLGDSGADPLCWPFSREQVLQWAATGSGR